MYDFEVKVTVPFLYEITYEETIREVNRAGCLIQEIKSQNSKRFTDWRKLREFAYSLKGKKILQVLEIKDMTDALCNDLCTQTKD